MFGVMVLRSHADTAALTSVAHWNAEYPRNDSVSNQFYGTAHITVPEGEDWVDHRPSRFFASQPNMPTRELHYALLERAQQCAETCC
jgi:hypothetical protein